MNASCRTTRRLITAALLLPVVLLLFGTLAASAHAEEPRRFDAAEVLRRAEVGSYAQRTQLPVELEPHRPTRPPNPSDFERVVCTANAADPVNRSIICRAQRAP